MVAMSTATHLPATMMEMSAESLLSTHVAENRLATASIAVRSCFLKPLMSLHL
jgi:hypothetical protein